MPSLERSCDVVTERLDNGTRLLACEQIIELFDMLICTLSRAIAFSPDGHSLAGGIRSAVQSGVIPEPRPGRESGERWLCSCWPYFS